MSTQLPDSQRSIRTSCDRCRIQKLKCIASPPKSPTSVVRCQRCIRAATVCVFSRRSNSKREPVLSEDSHSRSPCQKPNSRSTPSLDGPVSMQLTSLFDSGETQREWCDTSIEGVAAVIDPDLQFRGSSAHFMMPDPTSDFDMALIDPSLHYQLPLQRPGSELFHLSHDLSLLAPEPDAEGSAGFKISSPSLQCSSASSTSGISIISDGQPTYPRRVAAKSLLTLYITLEETLDQLANQTWGQEESEGSFHHYPVGSVLHLFQEFVDTVAGLREFRSCDRPCDERHFKSGDPPFYLSKPKADEPTTRQNTANPTSQLDASLVLIVLGCYATLTRICTIVLVHFKQHLKASTAHRIDVPAAITANRCDFTAATRLGELATPSESYTQIHTAASLLLELLEQATCALAPAQPTQQTVASAGMDVSLAIEAQMQQPTDGRIASCLMESAAGLRGAFSELQERSSELKEVLRRTMGL